MRAQSKPLASLRREASPGNANPTRLNLQSVVDAAERMKGELRQTPVIDGLKLENLQHTGAFKARGALNAVLAGIERGDRRPIIAASAGNHAAGIAWAASRAGLEAVTVVPRDAPRSKVDRIASYGAMVVQEGDDFEQAESLARKMAAQQNLHFVHPFDDPDVIAGQGTIALELLLARPTWVFVPIGGGGLAAGMGVVCREFGIPLVGVQIAGVDAMRRTLSGEPTQPTLCQTVADGLCVKTPGALTRVRCAQDLARIVTVTEQEVRHAMRKLLMVNHVVVEGAGAVAFAAQERLKQEGSIAVVTGGNVDEPTLSQVLNSSYPAQSDVHSIFEARARKR